MPLALGIGISTVFDETHGVGGLPPATSFLLLAGGTDFLLLADGTSKLNLAGV